jgi:hypothetical protein
MKKGMTLMQACRDFFGLKPGQTGLQFGQEYKALSDSDRNEIKAGLEAKGYEIIASGVLPAKVAEPA